MDHKRKVSTKVTNRSESDSDIYRKPVIRANFILGVLLSISILGCLYFYNQSRLYKQQLLRITKLPTPTPKYIYIEKPTPTVLEKNRITTSRQTVNLLVPKFFDSPHDKDTYIVSFDKMSSNSTYAVTSDMFPKLILSDDTYELIIQIPSEGFNQPLDMIPQIVPITTEQFNTVTRITNTELVNSYWYTTDYSTNCTQHKPLPKACSSKQVYFYPNSRPKKQVGVYMTCVSSNNVETCDKLVRSVTIDLE